MIPDGSNPLEIIIVAVGVFCLLKKVAGMERYYELRVSVLTTVIFLALFFSWLALVNSYEDRYECNCPDGFTLSEMVRD